MRCCFRLAEGASRRLLRWPALLLCCLMAFAGCRRSAPARPGQESYPANAKTYALKGVVVATDPVAGQVTIASEAIPGFMEAMTMPYKLEIPSIAAELHPGDHITGSLRVSDTASSLGMIVVTQQAQAQYKPAQTYNVPSAGESVPNFKFLNQNGKMIDIRQFRGNALLLTFIYTRCPLPDFCVRMSRNFAQIDRELASDPEAYKHTHLLSVSFDPAYDTPAVLRSYGGAYTGRYSKETFAHWDFAAPPQKELKQVEQFFDVGVTPGTGGTLTHSLSTVLIGKDGKILEWYPTNEWSPSAVAKALEKAAK